MTRATLTIGPRNCGKSLAVERDLASRWAHLLYVGTLATGDRHAAIIREHRKRRGPAWRLVETRGTLDRDRQAIGCALERWAEIDAVLIDGLVAWSTQSCQGFLVDHAVEVADVIARLVDSHPAIEWHLVDLDGDTLRREQEPVAARACDVLHARLKDRLGSELVVRVHSLEVTDVGMQPVVGG